MQYRPLGRTGWNVSTVSFGAWAIGGTWGAADDDESMKTLHRALDLGVNFFDTADVYGDGRSERLIARLRRERSEPFYVATKAGRRHTAARRGRLRQSQPDRLHRAQPGQPEGGGPRPVAAALPTDGGAVPA
jgi:aryl-alcohol dehydrogenase-like predicted oxidoreductase